MLPIVARVSECIACDCIRLNEVGMPVPEFYIDLPGHTFGEVSVIPLLGSRALGVVSACPYPSPVQIVVRVYEMLLEPLPQSYSGKHVSQRAFSRILH